MALPLNHSKEACTKSVAAIQDTLYVISGKWKLPIIVALSTGPKRFTQLRQDLSEITPKILSKELKELELNEFVTRTVYATAPVTVEYELTKYSETLNDIIGSMQAWGLQHRRRIQRKGSKELSS